MWPYPQLVQLIVTLHDCERNVSALQQSREVRPLKNLEGPLIVDRVGAVTSDFFPRGVIPRFFAMYSHYEFQHASLDGGQLRRAAMPRNGEAEADRMFDNTKNSSLLNQAGLPRPSLSESLEDEATRSYHTRSRCPGSLPASKIRNPCLMHFPIRGFEGQRRFGHNHGSRLDSRCRPPLLRRLEFSKPDT